MYLPFFVQTIRFEPRYSDIFSISDIGIQIAKIMIGTYCLKRRPSIYEKEKTFHFSVAPDFVLFFAEQFRAGLYTDGAAGRCNRALR